MPWVASLGMGDIPHHRGECAQQRMPRCTAGTARTHNAWRSSVTVCTGMECLRTSVLKSAIVLWTLWCFCHSSSNNNCRRVWSLTAAWSMSQSASFRICHVDELRFLCTQASASSPFIRVATSLYEVATVFASRPFVTSTSSSYADASVLTNVSNASQCSLTVLSPWREVRKTPLVLMGTLKPYKRHLFCRVDKSLCKLDRTSTTPDNGISRGC